MGAFNFRQKREERMVRLLGKAMADQPRYMSLSDYINARWTLTDRTKREFIDEAYKRLEWIGACVDKIGDQVSSVPWIIKIRNGKDWDDYEYGSNSTVDALWDLLNKETCPEMKLSSVDFFHLFARYMATQGENFCLLNNSVRPTSMFPLLPWACTPTPSEDGKVFLERFVYSPTGNPADDVEYEPDQVMWSRFIDPTNYHEGLSPLTYLSRTIETENSATDWNKALFDNKAVPPAIISVKDHIDPDGKQKEEFRKRWRKLISRVKGVRDPIVVDADKVTVALTGLSVSDMDFLNLRKMDRQGICAALGVPGQVVGDPEGQTYSNYEQAMKSFWQLTIIPRYLSPIRSTLNTTLAGLYGKELRIEYDLSNVEYLQESLESKHKRIVTSWEKNLIMRNQALKDLDMEELPPELGDVFFIDVQIGAIGVSNDDDDGDTSDDDRNQSDDNQDDNQDNDTPPEDEDLQDDEKAAVFKALEELRAYGSG